MSGIPAYTVEAVLQQFFGPVWVDITPYLELGAGPLMITRGRQDEQSTPQVGQMSCILANPDGRFTPGLTSSPYWPYVQDGAEVRVACRIPAGKNLEDNPSHETGTGEWSGVGPGTGPSAAPSTTRAHGTAGPWSMLVTWVNQASGSAAQRQVYGLTVGQQYTWSRWVYVPTGSPDAYLSMQGSGLLVNGTPTSTKDAWVQVSVTFAAIWTSHNLRVEVASSVGGGQCWTDDGQGETGAVVTSVDPGATVFARFYGFALEWSFGWAGPQASYATTSLVAVDLTSRLGDRAGKLPAFDVAEALLDGPRTLLPLDEAAAATQAGNLGSAVGAAPGVLANIGGGGTYAFAGATGPPADGTSSLLLTRASATSGYYLWVPTQLLDTACTVEAFVNTATASLTVANLSQSQYGSVSAGAEMTLSIDAAKKLQWQSDSGALVVTSPNVVADGGTHHVAATYVHNGTNHVATLWVDGQSVATGSVASTWVLVYARYLLVGGGRKLPLYTGAVNHVAVYGSALSGARLLAHWHAGWDGFGGERSDARVSRLAAYAGLSALTPAYRSGVGVWDDTALGLWDSTFVWAASDLMLETGYSTVYGQSGGGDASLAAMQAVADTESGQVLADTTGHLQFHARQHRYNRPAEVVLPAEYVTPALAPTYDTQTVANAVTVTTQDGAVYRYADSASVDQRGTYDRPVSSLTRDPLDAASLASWLGSRRPAPKVRYPNVTTDLLTLPAVVVASVLRLDVGDRLDVTGLPSQAPAPTASLFVEGYTETVTADSCTVAFNTSDATEWQVGIWDSASLGLWDSTMVWAL